MLLLLLQIVLLLLLQLLLVLLLLVVMHMMETGRCRRCWAGQLVRTRRTAARHVQIRVRRTESAATGRCTETTTTTCCCRSAVAAASAADDAAAERTASTAHREAQSEPFLFALTLFGALLQVLLPLDRIGTLLVVVLAAPFALLLAAQLDFIGGHIVAALGNATQVLRPFDWIGTKGAIVIFAYLAHFFEVQLVLAGRFFEASILELAFGERFRWLHAGE